MINAFCFHIFIYYKMRKGCFAFFTPSCTLEGDSYYSVRTIRKLSDLHIFPWVTITYMVNQITEFWASRFIHQKQFVLLHESILWLYFKEIPTGFYHVRSKSRLAFGSLFFKICLFQTLLFTAVRLSSELASDL